MIKKLSKRDVLKYRKTIGTAWLIPNTNNSLDRTVTFDTFVEAFMFVTRVGVHAEVMHLYPHIEIDQHRVFLSIGNAEAVGLTLTQFELAEKIDIVYALSTTAGRKHHTRA